MTPLERRNVMASRKLARRRVLRLMEGSPFRDSIKLPVSSPGKNGQETLDHHSRHIGRISGRARRRGVLPGANSVAPETFKAGDTESSERSMRPATTLGALKH